MKKISSLLVFISLVPAVSFSQAFDWVYSTEVNFNLNPALPVNMVCASDAGLAYTVYFNGNKFEFGSDIYGTDKVDCYNSSAELQWTLDLGTRALAQRIVVDENGNVYIGGTFMKSLVIAGSDTIENTGGNFSVNLFIICLNAEGNLAWKKNISVDHSNYTGIEALTLDQQGNLWYAASDFASSGIYELDASGNETTSYVLEGSKLLGGISFDSQGNLFVSGATSFPALTIVDLEVSVPETYMMYVARINSAGVGSWAQLASDITFQRPMVKADPSGNAFVSGNLMAPTSFGSISFLQPQWVYDVFLVRVDSMGNFLWGVQAPQDPGGITGDFMRGVNSFMDIDDVGNVYLTGTTRGTLDWGNGVISDAGSVTYGAITVMEFDQNGAALCAKNGGSQEFNQASALDVNGLGEIYFSASMTGIAAFDTISVNAGGDFASVVGKISTEMATSVSSIEDDQSLLVYPNPANDLLHINTSITDSRVRIFEVTGKCICDFMSGKNSNLDVSSLSEGIYLLQLVKGNEIKSTCFSVVR